MISLLEKSCHHLDHVRIVSFLLRYSLVKGMSSSSSDKRSTRNRRTVPAYDPTNYSEKLASSYLVPIVRYLGS